MTGSLHFHIFIYFKTMIYQSAAVFMVTATSVLQSKVAVLDECNDRLCTRAGQRFNKFNDSFFIISFINV